VGRGGLGPNGVPGSVSLSTQSVYFFEINL